MPSITESDSSQSHPQMHGRAQPYSNQVNGPVFELPVNNSSSSATSEERDDVDEEESELATAIALSLAESEQNLSRANRYTMGGTDISHLNEVLERSIVER
jgi:hypothetical protein